LGAALVPSDLFKATTPVWQGHQVKPRNALIQFQLGILGSEGNVIEARKNHLAEGSEGLLAQGLGP
jgi:hypothetical protein